MHEQDKSNEVPRWLKGAKNLTDLYSLCAGAGYLPMRDFYLNLDIPSTRVSVLFVSDDGNPTRDIRSISQYGPASIKENSSMFYLVKKEDLIEKVKQDPQFAVEVLGHIREQIRILGQVEKISYAREKVSGGEADFDYTQDSELLQKIADVHSIIVTFREVVEEIQATLSEEQAEPVLLQRKERVKVQVPLRQRLADFARDLDKLYRGEVFFDAGDNSASIRREFGAFPYDERKNEVDQLVLDMQELFLYVWRKIDTDRGKAYSGQLNEIIYSLIDGSRRLVGFLDKVGFPRTKEVEQFVDVWANKINLSLIKIYVSNISDTITDYGQQIQDVILKDKSGIGVPFERTQSSLSPTEISKIEELANVLDRLIAYYDGLFADEIDEFKNRVSTLIDGTSHTRMCEICASNDWIILNPGHARREKLSKEERRRVLHSASVDNLDFKGVKFVSLDRDVHSSAEYAVLNTSLLELYAGFSLAHLYEVLSLLKEETGQFFSAKGYDNYLSMEELESWSIAIINQGIPKNYRNLLTSDSIFSFFHTMEGFVNREYKAFDRKFIEQRRMSLGDVDNNFIQEDQELVVCNDLLDRIKVFVDYFEEDRERSELNLEDVERLISEIFVFVSLHEDRDGYDENIMKFVSHLLQQALFVMREIESKDYLRALDYVRLYLIKNSILPEVIKREIDFKQEMRSFVKVVEKFELVPDDYSVKYESGEHNFSQQDTFKKIKKALGMVA